MIIKLNHKFHEQNYINGFLKKIPLKSSVNDMTLLNLINFEVPRLSSRNFETFYINKDDLIDCYPIHFACYHVN